MNKKTILTLTGIGTGLVGSIAGAVLTKKLYDGNKQKVENGDIKDEVEIKKAKLKTRASALGTTLLAGLAIASGAGLAMSYGKDDKNNDSNDDYGKYYIEPNDKINEIAKEEDKWLYEIEDEYDNLLNENEYDEAISIKEFGVIKDGDQIERVKDILENTEESMDDIYNELNSIDEKLDNIDRNTNVALGIIEQIEG